MLQEADPEFKIGRDYLFDLMRENGMLVKYKKRFVKTTDSDHNLQIYPNLLTDLVIDKPNQVWVVDITYIDTYE